jgi:hypothetical protein
VILAFPSNNHLASTNAGDHAVAVFLLRYPPADDFSPPAPLPDRS